METDQQQGRSPLSPANRFPLQSGTRGSGQKQAPSSLSSTGYNTRSSKKKLSLGERNSTPQGGRSSTDLEGRAENPDESGASMTITTRSRAQLQYMQTLSTDQEGGDATMHDAQMDGNEEAGPSARMQTEGEGEGKASGSGDGQARSKLPGPGSKARANNPVIRLTTKLLDTYQGINEKYYAKHKRIYNDGYDDDHGDYIIRPGDLINGRYEITSKGSTPMLGRGSFGQVVFAIDKKSKPNREVAVKIIRNHRHWHEQAKFEIELLKKFVQMPPVKNQGDWVDYSNVVRLLDDFVFRNHCCLVFELLPFTLYDLLKISRFRGVSLQLVSRFAQNLMRTLECLKQADVIHCDLKPENVMLVKVDDHRVKVIDFGSSCSSRRQPFTYIQSRFYRSPEVLLCRPYSYAIDMWSLGCILVEMHTGQPLFNGKNEAEQMCKVCDILGMPPAHMIAKAGYKSKVKDLFKKDGDNYKIVYEKKPYDTMQASDYPSKDFRAIIRRPTPQPCEPEYERLYNLFEDLVLKMLEFDPERRITPEDALMHPFLHPENSARREVDRMEMSPRPETPQATPRQGEKSEKGKVDQAVQT